MAKGFYAGAGFFALIAVLLIIVGLGRGNLISLGLAIGLTLPLAVLFAVLGLVAERLSKPKAG